MPLVRLNAGELLQYGRDLPWKPVDLMNGILVTEDEALEHGLCPETGIPLDSVNIPEHIARLWPRERNEDAQRRIAALEKIHQAREADKQQQADNDRNQRSRDRDRE